ncbi:MAG: hypothetical protein U0168_30875 [Nannocystaceae bacterium]
MKRLSLTLTALSLVLLGACEQQSTTDSMEHSAAKLAQLHHVEDYSIQIVAAPADPMQPDVSEDAPQTDAALSTEMPDPEELRVACYEWQDDSGCSTCVVTWGRCSFWSSECLGDTIWSNC